MSYHKVIVLTNQLRKEKKRSASYKGHYHREKDLRELTEKAAYDYFQYWIKNRKMVKALEDVLNVKDKTINRLRICIASLVTCVVYLMF